ncbi:DNA-binding MarR family transcriptional regulator [Allocatelliglobosispora scoriae]|uniref:DNA-binding MarR family transcriptional regulator n=1 Tax=Allocatelliglobosispora scoriae TaxID=643052 RepID=A0A841C1I8_9ACTN|nr:MarR family transcriptional regulator [Allocatelliglobosispora scoriae]MBB5873795.1 DNA-binding MarR family transcriptional regulator [Allocatelliglobosispora scoriae]
MASPRWLDDDEQATWRALIATIGLVEESLDKQLQRDSEMPHAYYMILAMLSEADGRALRMSELASINNYSQSRLSHAVARLEERGWVRRDPCPTDKRGNIAVLTDAGLAALVESAPGHVEEVRRRIFDPLTSAEAHQLGVLCRKILAGEAGARPTV